MTALAPAASATDPISHDQERGPCPEHGHKASSSGHGWLIDASDRPSSRCSSCRAGIGDPSPPGGLLASFGPGSVPAPVRPRFQFVLMDFPRREPPSNSRREAERGTLHLPLYAWIWAMACIFPGRTSWPSGASRFTGIVLQRRPPAGRLAFRGAWRSSDPTRPRTLPVPMNIFPCLKPEARAGGGFGAGAAQLVHPPHSGYLGGRPLPARRAPGVALPPIRWCRAAHDPKPSRGRGGRTAGWSAGLAGQPGSSLSTGHFYHNLGLENVDALGSEARRALRQFFTSLLCSCRWPEWYD